MSTPAETQVDVDYIPPTCPSFQVGPCQGARCDNKTQRYGNHTPETPSSPLCNVCVAKLEAWRANKA